MPTEFFNQVIDLLQALWATPNRWLRRLIVVAVVTPFLSMAFGMWYGPLAMVTALIPVILVAGWVALRIDPLVVGIINQYSFGKKLTGWIILICGVELAWAFFCGIFPLENDLRVSFTALFSLIAAAALAGGSAYLKLEFAWPKKLAKLLVFSAVVCGVILILVGNDKPKTEKSILKRVVSNALETKSELAEIVASFGGQNFSAPPICVGASLTEFKVGDVVIGKPLSMECSTGWIRIPYGSSFYIDTKIEPDIHYLFSDGSVRHVTPKSQPRGRQFPTHEFRVWGKGTPTYTVRQKSL